MTQGDAFVPGDALNNVEILYVDDEPHRRDAMRKMLANLAPRRVQIAESAAEALKVVMGMSCNLLIAEHKMKAMDGIGLVRELRSVKNYPRALIPALLLGDPVGSDIIKAALAAGANHFLIKPLSPGKLYERMQWALNDNRPFVLKDGHYVFKPLKKTSTGKAANPALAAPRV